MNTTSVVSIDREFCTDCEYCIHESTVHNSFFHDRPMHFTKLHLYTRRRAVIFTLTSVFGRVRGVFCGDNPEGNLTYLTHDNDFVFKHRLSLSHPACGTKTRLSHMQSVRVTKTSNFPKYSWVLFHLGSAAFARNQQVGKI